MFRIARYSFALLITTVLFSLFALSITYAAEPVAAIVVTTTADNQTVDGECSLREAIIAANTNTAVDSCAAGAGRDVIRFGIPGDGPHIIKVQSPLPAITASIAIDGYSQAGATTNTNRAPQALNTVLKIMIDGSDLPTGETAGLHIQAEETLIRGLAIGGFTFGILLAEGDNHAIEGNFIGTNISGTAAIPNYGGGIYVYTSNNIIGVGEENSAGDRNLISGNGQYGGGITLDQETANFNVVNGNLIGTDISGSNALGNIGANVIIVNSASFNRVVNNVIAASQSWGIVVQNGASDNIISGNYIGTNSQDDELGNGEGGILARNSGPQTIGGLFTQTGGCCEGNVIAHNKGNGITIKADINVSLYKGILSNRIYNNEGLGIDLADDGVTLNDEGDADGEQDANSLQNFPIITAAHVISNNLIVTGTLNSIAENDFRIEFFANDQCDPSGYGEGQRVLGNEIVTTDAGGNVSFTFTLTGTVPTLANVGNLITSTATDLMGNTSEFSQCVRAMGDGEEPELEPSLFVPFVLGNSSQR